MLCCHPLNSQCRKYRKNRCRHDWIESKEITEPKSTKTRMCNATRDRNHTPRYNICSYYSRTYTIEQYAKYGISEECVFKKLHHFCFWIAGDSPFANSARRIIISSRISVGRGMSRFCRLSCQRVISSTGKVSRISRNSSNSADV